MTRLRRRRGASHLDPYYAFVNNELRDERVELAERALAGCRCDRRLVDPSDAICVKCGHQYAPTAFYEMFWGRASQVRARSAESHWREKELVAA